MELGGLLVVGGVVGDDGGEIGGAFSLSGAGIAFLAQPALAVALRLAQPALAVAW